MYRVRMARVNISLPDDLLAQARAAGLNVSQTAARALLDELDRLAKIAELDAYLSELDAELGPVSEQERQEAEAWWDEVLSKRPAAKQGSKRSA